MAFSWQQVASLKATKVSCANGGSSGAKNVALIEDIAIRGCRKGVWNTVLSRHHEIRKVFACDADEDALDLILVGVVDIESLDGQKHAHEFIARSLVVRTASSPYRVKHYQVLIPTPKTPQPLLA
jgi:hypothetical protein